MRKFLLLITFHFVGVSLLTAQSISVIQVEDMEKVIHEQDAKTKVINFWATWCKPCIEEIPYFEAINENPDFEDFEIVLISLDFVEDLDNRVKKFIEKKGIKSTVMLLDDVDYNSWIDKVDPSWSGAIPATLIVNTGKDKRKFFERQFKAGELEDILVDFRSN